MVVALSLAKIPFYQFLTKYVIHKIYVFDLRISLYIEYSSVLCDIRKIND